MKTKISDFKYSIICDVDGCTNLVTKEISINGLTPHTRLCEKCFNSLAEGIKEHKAGGKKNGEKR